MAITRSTSWTAVANQALLLLGYEPIANIDTDNTTPGTRCRGMIGSAVRNVLDRHDWRGAAKRVSLGSPLSTAPANGYTYAFSMPADCVRPWEEGAETGGARYSIEGQKLLTDAEEVILTYVFFPEQPTEITDGIIKAIEMELAKLLAPVMAKGKETIQITLGLAAATLSDAIASDGPRKDYQKPAASLGHTWGDENR